MDWRRLLWIVLGFLLAASLTQAGNYFTPGGVGTVVVGAGSGTADRVSKFLNATTLVDSSIVNTGSVINMFANQVSIEPTLNASNTFEVFNKDGEPLFWVNSITGNTIHTAPTLGTTSPLVQFELAALVSPSANGTFIGTNPAAFTGDFVNFQVAGVSVLRINADPTLVDAFILSYDGAAHSGIFFGLADTASSFTVSAASIFLSGVDGGSPSINMSTGNGIMLAVNPLFGEQVVIGDGTKIPPADATKALVILPGPLVGGSASGTFIGANPAAAFTGDFLNFQLAGVSKFKVTGTGSFFTGFGSAAAPAWSFVGDEDTGIFRSASNEIAVTTLGVQRLAISVGSNIFSTLKWWGPLGTVSQPAVSFSAVSDAGMYFDGGPGELAFATNGVKRLGLGTNATFTGAIRGPSGSAGTPTFSFTTLTGTGMFASGTGLGFSADFSLTAKIDGVGGLPPASAIRALLQLGGTAIVGGAASGTYIGANNTFGFTGDFINFQLAGATKFKVDNTGIFSAAAGTFFVAAAVGASPAANEVKFYVREDINQVGAPAADCALVARLSDGTEVLVQVLVVDGGCP